MKREKHLPEFIPGQRVRLAKMDGERLPIGTEGTVTKFSDLGDWAQLFVDWDNGSRLIVALPDDKVALIDSAAQKQN